MKIFAFVIVSLILPATLFGQNSIQPEPNNIPSLGGHRFIPNSKIASPFTNTHIGIRLGIASTDVFDNISLEIDGEEIIGLKGSLLFADLNFEYQQQIKNWIAVYFTFGVTARVGTELQSMLTQGINTVGSFKMGWVFKLIETEKLLFSGSLQINNYTTNFINVKKFLQDAINNQPEPSISENIPILNGNGGLRFAYGINSLMGFQIYGELGYGDSFDRGKSIANYSLGGTYDFDFFTISKVPLGLSLFANMTSFPEIVQITGKQANSVGVKLSFTSAKHYNFGFELSRISVPVFDIDENVNSSAMFITSNYYFN